MEVKLSTTSSIVRINDEEAALKRYLNEINKLPILTPVEEYNLAKAYQNTKDLEAAHKLVTCHLRLVAKIAMEYRGYGLPIDEVISEGNIGLMQAVKKFEPDKGFRLATYAIWWIRASIQEYVLRSWSLVKIGTTQNQKRLFYNLKKIKNNISAFDNKELSQDQVKLIANKLNVSEKEVVEMNQRLVGDVSLNKPVGGAQGEELMQWQDWLQDDSDDQEQLLIAKNEHKYNMQKLEKAMKTLSERDADIFRARRLKDPAETLESLSVKYNISRERVRQIEMKSYEKLQAYIKNSTN